MSAPEAELALIGCMLINPACVPGVAEIATGRDIFLSRENAAIASAISTVYEQTGTVAGAAVIQRLRDDGKWDDVLTAGRMDTAITHADSGVNWEFYARTLCDKADRRKLAAELVTAERRLLHDESLDAWRASVMEKLMGHQGAGSRDVDAYSAARSVLERFKASEPTNVKTGFARFDDRFGGLPIGGLVTILGTPGSGKSTFALNLAVNLARKERWAGRVFSYEMPAFRLATSVLCNISGVSIYGYQREGRQPDLQRMGQLEAAAGELRGMDLAFVDDCLNHEEIAARVAMYARKGVKFVVVDYIQNLPAANPTTSKRSGLAAMTSGSATPAAPASASAGTSASRRSW